MKTFLALLHNNIKMSISQKPISFFIMLVLPVIIIVTSSKVINYKITYINIGLVDEDHTYTSEYIMNLVESVDGTQSYYLSEEEVESNFKNNTINVAIVLKEGFEEALINGEIDNVTVYANEGSNDYMLISSLLKNHLLNMRNLGRVSHGDQAIYIEAIQKYIEDSELVTVDALNDLYADYNNSNLFVGFLIMLIFFKATSVANTINTDRENNVYSRIFISPVKTWQYFGANNICNTLIAMLQIVFSVVIMHYFVDVSMGMSSWALFIILSLIALVAVSFGTLCVALAKDGDTASMFSNMFILIFVLLGGSFIQVEFFPTVINWISYLSPVRWAIASVLALQGGASFSDITPYLICMMGMAIIFFVISFVVTDRKDKGFVSIRN